MNGALFLSVSFDLYLAECGLGLEPKREGALLADLVADDRAQDSEDEGDPQGHVVVTPTEAHAEDEAREGASETAAQGVGSDDSLSLIVEVVGEGLDDGRIVVGVHLELRIGSKRSFIKYDL